MMGERLGVLVAAAGEPWEVEALRALSTPPSGVVVLKRCVDLADLLASASTGQARVAVVAAGLPGLDADSVGSLRRSGVAVVAVTEPGSPTAAPSLPGVHETVAACDVAGLAAAALAASDATDHDEQPDGLPSHEEPPLVEPSSAGRPAGRVVAVWGPAGAPGRTTVAVNLASALAARGHDTLLVDADGYGGAVGQHLGVLEEVSGLLSAVRLANTGRLDVDGLAAVARATTPSLRVLTGLPRADRWVEVRPAPFDTLMENARALCDHVVLDLGFCLEQEPAGYGSSGPHRNHMTVAGLDHADEVVVVGSADPVGLARLARGLVELPEVAPAATIRVVVNRMRPSLGWGEQEVRAMVEGFVTPASMHFLPHDPGPADRALVAGRPLLEAGDSALTRALGQLADAVEGEAPGAVVGRWSPRLRRRRAGRAR
ncbi:MAG TPA: hypothetical protein VFR87_06910 [Nocardioidaceae bacterium]|nr:hypothetical protein [Nocardioidaceae bacterium]